MGEVLPFAVLIEVLFAHAPGPAPGVRLTGDEVCRRANHAVPGRLLPSVLSSLRRGRTLVPHLETIAAVAAGFGVDVAFFTAEFHHRHQHLTMAERVV
ncbi:MAG: hypothetical protein DI630_26495 [Gordonia sp. (in: high G+C Gram-positive bacteria)]|nr:MAG: hypothetical protein DI630_26495 [Gordonia sp. (in: high G+C Gram-positive bacteria)]